MARVTITVPDDLLQRARAAGLNMSQMASLATLSELDRLAKLAALKADRESDEAGQDLPH